MAQPESKRQKLDTSYELLYHSSIPGRGEFIRLAFEAAKTPYTDVSNATPEGYTSTVLPICCSPTSTSDGDGNPPVFSPPALRVLTGQTDKKLIIHQTPNILSYLGPRLGLVGDGGDEVFYVAQIALTALDMNNEVHDTHHPIAAMKYYKDQKEQALLKAADFRETRIPKFLSYFERVLKANHNVGSSADGAATNEPRYLVGESLTYADTTVWQVLDGLKFAFPNEIKARFDEFPVLFEEFYESLKRQAWLAAYLESDRRLPYSTGVYRHYPELDRQ